jgi:hypothetical protein
VVAGRTEWKWTPHMYTVQADLGAVTGAQASIYKRATVIRRESLPLLEGLRPLLPDADEEDTEASRAIIESNLIELVDELGLVGGPRVQRVDTYFKILLNIDPETIVIDIDPENIDPTTTVAQLAQQMLQLDAEQVGGELGLLRDRFGLQRDLVNTIEEEQNLTNFLVLVDYIGSLMLSWVSQRGFFDRRGTDVFLGTQLVLISRDLASLVEAVYEARDALDSVFVGEADRQSLPIRLDGNETELTIAELLAWAERFGSEEGPRLIREGGKKGLRSILITIDELRELLRRAWELSLKASNPVRGFHTPRVARTFEELVIHADRIYECASQLDGAPIIETLEPDSLPRGEPEEKTVTICGDNFKERIPDKGNGKNIKVVFSEEANVSQKKRIDVRSVTRVSSNELSVKIVIPGDATLGKRDVTVTNPDGKSFTKERAFEVIEGPPEEYGPPPSCTSFEPEGAIIGEWHGEMTIKGQVRDVQCVDLVHEDACRIYLEALAQDLLKAKDLDLDGTLDDLFDRQRQALLRKLGDSARDLVGALGPRRREEYTTAIRSEVPAERGDNEISVTFDWAQYTLLHGWWYVVLVDKSGRHATCEDRFEITIERGEIK